MKKAYQYIALAALAFTFAACTQEEDFTPQGNQKDAPLAIASAGVAELTTRATITDGNLVEGSIGVFVKSENGGRYEGSNIKWTYNNDGWGLDDATVVLFENDGAKQQIGAYYPYTSELTEGVFTLELPEAYGSDYEKYDYLYGDCAPLSSNPATITMNHLMAKVTVSIQGWGAEAVGDVVESIAIVGVPRTATWTLPGATLSEYGNGESIDLYYNEGSYGGYALPNGATDITLRIKMDESDGSGRIFTATASLDDVATSVKTEVLTSGTHYHIGVKLGKDKVGINSVNVIDWAQTDIDGGVAEEVDYIYNESTNTYTVRTADALNTAISNAKTSGTAEKPAKIMLMNDIAVEGIENEYGNIEYAVLIETGNIIVDLNGCQLSATNDPLYTIQIGAEWGELCDAVVTIDDSSMDKSGKIVGLHSGIHNNGGTLIFNNGTIEVNSTAVADAASGISSYKGSVTVNGGTINVTGVAEHSVTSGISEDGTGGTVTINGGSINVNGPSSWALIARSSWSIKGGTITSNGYHIDGSTVSLQTNDEGIGATFVGGIKCYNTLNSLLSEGVGYYDADGNLIEVADDVTEITGNGDITVKKIPANE